MSSIYTCCKSVKGEIVVHQEIADSTDIEKIEQILQKLEQLPKVSKSKLDELDLRTNPKKWAISLTKSYPDNVNKQEMENLLVDFTDAMRTRMREESKYAIGLLTLNKLILCHSLFGEETITPEWKTIPRMLDADNVFRYVFFTTEKGIITVKFWEREATSSFIEWLGLPRKQSFLFGGKYRIYCEIEDITTSFELTEEEMKDWIKRHPELREGRIIFSTPIQLLNISEIRVGRKRYEKAEDFIQDYEAESYGFPYYQKEYDRINRSVLPLLMKYYDERTRVVKREGEEETTEVIKSTLGFDVLFVNENIEFRASYLTDIVRRFINGEPMKVCHAGLKFRASSFVLGSMAIYNDIRLDPLTQRMVEYYKDTNLQDRNLDTLLKCAILGRLAQVNWGLPIVYFLEPLYQETMKSVTLKGRWSKLEDKVLEYKSRDFLAGGDAEVIKKLSEDIGRKLEESSCKIYIIGIEDDGTVNPLPTFRLKSDRIETIKNGILSELGIPAVYALPLIQKDEGILLIIGLCS